MRYIASIVTTVCLISWHATFGQIKQPVGELPFDSTLVLGKLKNGFSYYLHKTNSDYTFVYLVVKAGRNQERSDQRELAHVLEHMPFIQTKRFTEIESTFQQSGIVRGTDFNASVASDRTFYFIRVPSDRQDLLRDAVQFFRDCANDIVTSPENINTAKASVLQEILSNGGRVTSRQVRIAAMGDTKYANRASEDVLADVKNFKHSSLTDYYKAWYKSNNQAIIVVGNFDVDTLTQTISENFSKIKRSKLKEEGVDKLATSDIRWKNAISFVRDYESEKSGVEVFFRKSSADLSSISGLQSLINSELVEYMMESRFKQYSSFDSQFKSIEAPTYMQDIAVLGPQFDAVVERAIFDSSEVNPVMRRLFLENEKVRRFGFSKAEFSDAIANVNFDVLCPESSQEHALQLVEHFVTGRGILSKDNCAPLIQELLRTTSIESVNQYAKEWFDVSDNLAIVFKNVTPSMNNRLVLDSVLFDIRKIQNEAIEPFDLLVKKLERIPTQIMDSLEIEQLRRKLKGIFLSITIDDKTGVQTVTFGNGVKLLVKELPNSDPAGIIYLKSVTQSISGCVSGQSRLLKDNASYIVSQSGLGTFTKRELDMFFKINGIQRLNPYASSGTFGFSATFSNRSVEKALQALYLYNMSPKVDSVVAFNQLSRSIEDSRNYTRPPSEEITDTIQYYRNGRCWNRSDKDQVENVDVDSILAYFKDHSTNTEGTVIAIAGDFVFSSEVLTLFAKYIGNLPKKSVTPTVRGDDRAKEVNPPHYVVLHRNKINMSDVHLELLQRIEYSVKHKVILEFVKDYLSNELFTRLRNKERGTYSVNVSVDLNRIESQFVININFSCSPERVDWLIDAVKDELGKLRITNVSAAVFNRIRSSQKRAWTQRKNASSFWVSYLLTESKYGKRFTELYEEDKILDEISPEDVRKFCENYLDQERLSIYILSPQS